jgi:hypothetical protein
MFDIYKISRVEKLLKYINILIKLSIHEIVGKILTRFFDNFQLIHTVNSQRKFLSIKLGILFDNTIAYGPFKGVKLLKNQYWSRFDRASMLLGLYENEILHHLTQIPKNYKYFIDLGAADGYYSVGVIKANIFEHSYCFELTSEGRKAIKECAKLNLVSDRITINGLADQHFYKTINLNSFSSTVLLIDIEGAEFNLLTDHILEQFKNSILFVELHEGFIENSYNELQSLRDRVSKFFKITEITTGSRDLSTFIELNEFADSDRWLICSEGRPYLMKWWRLDPNQ